MATGDLINDGRNRIEYEAYTDAVARASVPVMSLPGNHDLLAQGSSERAGREVYEEMLGPAYYSFDYGNRHYVMLNTVEEMSRQVEWLKHDLALQPPDRDILIFRHFPPTDATFRNFSARAEMELYAQYPVRAVFSGHKHSDRVMQVGTIVYVQTPPMLGRGLDGSPRTHRLITFHEGRMEIANFSAGYGNQDEFAEPMPVADKDAPPIRLNQDWPMFKGNPAGTGESMDCIRPPFKIAWTRSLGGTIFMASPVVGNGAVYIGVGDSRNRGLSGVYALDAINGNVLWHYPTVGKVAHSVSLADGLVLASSHDGVIHCIDARSGKGKWTYSLGSPLECWLYTAPLVYNRQVFAGMGLHFTALDVPTGKPAWRWPELSMGCWPSYSSPVVAHSNLFCAFPGVGARLSDPLTGQALWQGMAGDKPIVMPSENPSTPAVRDGTVYVASGSTLYALDERTGVERWHRGKAGFSSPVAASNGVILITGQDVVKLDASTGGARWTYSGAKLRKGGKPRFYFDSLFMATPLLSGGCVYVCTTDGQLVVLNEVTSEELTVMDMKVPMTSSPACSGNTLFLCSYNGTVFALVANP